MDQIREYYVPNACRGTFGPDLMLNLRFPLRRGTVQSPLFVPQSEYCPPVRETGAIFASSRVVMLLDIARRDATAIAHPRGSFFLPFVRNLLQDLVHVLIPHADEVQVQVVLDHV